MEKTIVILAKSIKNGNFCIAGKDLNTKEWVRPVSDENGGAITREQSKLTFHGAKYAPWDSAIFHKVKIDFSTHSPLYFQPENYVISGRPWLQDYHKAPPEILFSLLDKPETLWGNNSFKINQNVILNGVDASLYLVYVQDMNLYKNDRGKRKVNFIYNGVEYDNFSCTDPNFDYLINKQSRYNEAILCLSLGELFESDNCHYKIVASIFV